jgi:hypothetical protein
LFTPSPDLRVFPDGSSFNYLILYALSKPVGGGKAVFALGLVSASPPLPDDNAIAKRRGHVSSAAPADL